MFNRKRIPARRLSLTILSLTLVASILACSLPFGGAKPTAAPTDTGFQPPSQQQSPTRTAAPGEAQETPQAPPAVEKPTDRKITIGITNAIAASGLLELILPSFSEQTGYQVRLEVGGAGRSFKLGEKSLIDVMLVDDPGGERKYIADGFGRDRVLVMYSDFVLLGPADDPAGVKAAVSAVDAFKKIASSQAKFVSRGDDSVIAAIEADIWEKAGISPQGDWYTRAEQGTEGTLKLASDKKAYALSDRQTYLANKVSIKLEILYAGDPELFYLYHAITSNPDRSAKINYEGAQAFVQFLTSPEIQGIIAQFGTDKYGQPIFFAAAGKTE